VTEAELIARVVQSRDRDAFGALVVQHQSSVRNFLRHLTRGDAARADDLAQDTFVQAYRAVTRFQGRSTFSSWLLGIAHNLWRNDRRRVPLVTLEPEQVDEMAAVPSTTRLSDLRHDIALALRRLPPDEQPVVHLFYRQGLTHEEISLILNLPLGTVKTHLNRSRDKLRTLLSPWSTKS
jgi:RNA polymerase sigma-70 factor (ECF subfamily)